MSLKQQIQQDMVAAMKAGDNIATGALRMVKAAVLKFEVSGPKKEATDEEVLHIIGKEIKSRRDSIEQFRVGNREDLAIKEEAEVKILQKYLPSQLSEEELRPIIKETMAAVGVSSKSEKGKLMGALMPKVKGKADGGMVNKMVEEMLQ